MSIARSLPTTVFEMSEHKDAKKIFFKFLPFFKVKPRKKKKRRFYGKSPSEGLSELFFELKLHEVNKQETKKER